MKNPALMTVAQINQELDKLDKLDSALTTELIDAGRGYEKSNETMQKSDPLALRFRALMVRRYAVRHEMESRYGPGAPSRLPRGFGVRKRNPMNDPYNSAPVKNDPWKGREEKRDRTRNPPQVLIVDRRAGKVVVQRVRNPIDIMTALNAAGDLAMIREFSDEKRAGAFKVRRKNPYGAGKCPPHLKKFRFKKVR